MVVWQFEYVDWLSDHVGLQIEDRLRDTNLFEQWMSRSNGFREATIYDAHTFDFVAWFLIQDLLTETWYIGIQANHRIYKIIGCQSKLGLDRFILVVA